MTRTPSRRFTALALALLTAGALGQGAAGCAAQSKGQGWSPHDAAPAAAARLDAVEADAAALREQAARLDAVLGDTLAAAAPAPEFASPPRPAAAGGGEEVCPQARALLDRICELAQRICGLSQSESSPGSLADHCEDAQRRCAAARTRVDARCPQDAAPAPQL